MSRKVVATDGAPGAIGPYSQGIVTDGWLFTCGQVALDPATGKLSGDDAASQARRALRNIEAILRAAGSDLNRVVRTTVYLLNMDDFAAVNEVYAGFFQEEPPARSCVEVRRLPLGALVEIDAVARVG